jgi:phage tail-like protein
MAEFVPFRFRISLYDDEGGRLCSANFSELAGLEMTMEPRTIAQGGENWGEVQRVGPTRFSPVVLKRGVTESKKLWNWLVATTRGAQYGQRARAVIEVMDRAIAQEEDEGEGTETIVMTWHLTQVLPTRFKGPDLSSTASQVAIEELTLVYEDITLETRTADVANEAEL